MERNSVVRFVEGYHKTERNPDVPQSWTIYNAPRPLRGHMSWQGPFRHGIFYVAVAPPGDPADEFGDSELFTERNRSLDGHVCEWISREEIEEWGRSYCADNDVEYSDFDYSEVVRAYLNLH